MCPLLIFHLFGMTFTIGAYRFFTVAAVCAGMMIALPLLHRERVPFRHALGLLLLLAAAFLAGARILNLLVNPNAYGSALQPWTPRLAGFSLYGGLIGALAALLLWLWRKRQSAWPLLDAFVLPGGIAFALARIGCFLNGCCFGKPTSIWLGVEFPAKKSSLDAFVQGIPLINTMSHTVYPTQIFEMAPALLGLLPVMWLYLRHKLPPGAAFLIYGLWFTAMRWAILPLRSLPYADVVVHGVYPLLYGCLLLAGALMLCRRMGWLKRKSV